MIRSCWKPTVEFWFILTVSDVSSICRSGKCLGKVFYNFWRRVCLRSGVWFNLFASTTTTTKLIGFKCEGVIPTAILGIAIIISSTSITVHIFQRIIASTSFLSRQILLLRISLIQITIGKLTKLVIGPSSKIAAVLTIFIFVLIAERIAVLFCFDLIRSNNSFLWGIAHFIAHPSFLRRHRLATQR